MELPIIKLAKIYNSNIADDIDKDYNDSTDRKVSLRVFSRPNVSSYISTTSWVDVQVILSE